MSTIPMFEGIEPEKKKKKSKRAHVTDSPPSLESASPVPKYSQSWRGLAVLTAKQFESLADWVSENIEAIESNEMQTTVEAAKSDYRAAKKYILAIAEIARLESVGGLAANLNLLALRESQKRSSFREYAELGFTPCSLSPRKIDVNSINEAMGLAGLDSVKEIER